MAAKRLVSAAKAKTESTESLPFTVHLQQRLADTHTG